MFTNICANCARKPRIEIPRSKFYHFRSNQKWRVCGVAIVPTRRNPGEPVLPVDMVKTLSDDYAIVVRKHKRVQEPVGPHNCSLDHVYAVMAGELEILNEGRWWPAPSQSLSYFRLGTEYAIRQKAGYTGPVRIIFIQFCPPETWKPVLHGPPLRLPGPWWRRYLDLDARAEFNSYGYRVITVETLLQFMDSLASAAIMRPLQTRSEQESYAGPRRTGTAADWMEIWARAEELIRTDGTGSLTVQSLASAVHVSPMQLRRIYQAAGGVSPKAALTAWRMERAKKLLRESDSSITEIAKLLGYRTIQRFSAAFKEQCGQSPDDFASADKKKN
jgi:AraC-like DNA-binding protein